ncbi:hypothetical protein WN943_016102 [Citrus x changshan-huyou]
MGNSLQKPIENRQSPRQEKENPRQEEIKEEELEDIDGTFTCDICIEPMSVNNKFKNNNLCTHPFCQDCTAKYIEVKVRDNNTAKVECPGLHCEQFLDPFACKPTIPSSLFIKWCDHLCEDYVLGFERSYCPNRNCMAVMVNECEEIGRVKKAQCPKCKQWFCFQCKLPWHAGYRCEESGNLRDRNDIAFGKLLEKMNWTRCPGCGNFLGVLGGVIYGIYCVIKRASPYMEHLIGSSEKETYCDKRYCKINMRISQQKPIENRECIPQQEKVHENPRQEIELEDTNGIFTCEICIEPISANEKFRNKNLCSHHLCQDCKAKYIEVKVQDNNTAKIECPGLHCEQFLDPFSCKLMIPSNIFSKWCDVLFEDYVLGFERSYCPSRNCMALVVNECEINYGTLRKARCPNCKEWFCFQCKVVWHAGYRCEESGNLRDWNDIAFSKLVESMHWARCPACGSCVERKEGCRVMYCRFIFPLTLLFLTIICYCVYHKVFVNKLVII